MRFRAPPLFDLYQGFDELPLTMVKVRPFAQA